MKMKTICEINYSKSNVRDCKATNLSKGSSLKIGNIGRH